MRKPRVLFLCSNNSARSQMAEAFLRKYAGDHFEVYSAGLDPQPIHPYVVEVMKELGYDLDDHYPKDLKKYLGRVHFGIVITVCPKAEEMCPTIPGVGTRLYWPFGDPVEFQGSGEEHLTKFREVRDQIYERVRDG